MLVNTFLSAYVGKSRALVIGCIECVLDLQPHHGEIFKFMMLGNAVNMNDLTQYETVVSLIRSKRLNTIVVLGHHHCHALDYLLNDVTPDSPAYAMHLKIKDLDSENHGKLLNATMRNRILVDQNVIRQCIEIANAPALSLLLKQGKLTISGIVVNGRGTPRAVFRNGVSCNSFVMMN